MLEASRLTFVIDSNVFYAIEPHALSPTDPHDLAARFARLVADNGHLIVVHEGTRDDALRDSDRQRRAHRAQVLEKYRCLEQIPVSERIAAALPQESENDRVDIAIASAVDANAAHYLVTEDRRLQRRLHRAVPDLADRIVSLAQAVELLDALHPEAKEPPPLVELVPCYRIPLAEPIFTSIREDYQPDFDDWYKNKCQRAHREAFVIYAEDGGVAGLCIFKDEHDREYGLPPRRMKLCTLKVAEDRRGQRLGELLVKAALDNAIERRRAALSVTVLEKQAELLGLLGDLGFEMLPARTERDELVLVRSLDPPPGAMEDLDPFEFNRRYGPRHLNANVPIHLVPIRPRWEQRLFPERQMQLDLLGGSTACGNGLRKAYLSRSLNRQVQRGDILLLYRSEDVQAVRFVAVAEATLAGSDYLDLARFVGTRTVYTVEEIRDMTENGEREVNAILMRQARKIEPAWTLEELQRRQVTRKAPQSIQRIMQEGEEWVRTQLAA